MTEKLDQINATITELDKQFDSNCKGARKLGRIAHYLNERARNCGEIIYDEFYFPGRVDTLAIIPERRPIRDTLLRDYNTIIAARDEARDLQYDIWYSAIQTRIEESELQMHLIKLEMEERLACTQ